MKNCSKKCAVRVYKELLKDITENCIEQTLQSKRTVLRPVHKKRVYHISRVILFNIA